MNSLILMTAGRVLKPLLLLVSIVVLLRGHNDPGGGFVGGLLAAAAFALDAVIGRTSRARRALRVSPHLLLGAGLLLAAASGIPALLRGQPILTKQAYDLVLPFDLHFALSTVLVFDVGVYIVVLGTVLLIVFTLGEQ